MEEVKSCDEFTNKTVRPIIQLIINQVTPVIFIPPNILGYNLHQSMCC